MTAPERPPLSKVTRPEWVAAEYARIGREREEASRAADRSARWELVRVCGEMIGWTVAGAAVSAIGFHVHGRDIGMVFFYAGMVVNWGGVLFSMVCGYRRGEARGDW